MRLYPLSNQVRDTATGLFWFAIFLVVLVGLSTLMTGCASQQYGGMASYSVKPFLDGDGKATCCDVQVNNGKEIAALKAHIAKTKDGDYIVDLEEQGVAAFQGQAISASALKTAADAAVKSALIAAGVIAAPVLAPAAGAALASPGIGAAALGAAGVLGAQAVQPSSPITTATLNAAPAGSILTIPKSSP